MTGDVSRFRPQHVKADEVVGVLEEDVGPEGAYYRCRASRSEGLYPKHALLRLPAPDKTN